MDGTVVIKELMKEVKNRGETHVALTDHANMHGAVEFYLAAKSNGITPIIGCELYHEGLSETLELARDEKVNQGPYHLTTLAKNNEGYSSLLKLVSSGYIGDNIKDVPVISQKDLKEHSKELVALSSCLRGEFGSLVKALKSLQGSSELIFDYEDEKCGPVCHALKTHVEKILAVFGDGNYYVELIDNNLLEQKLLIPSLVLAARHFGLPIVATGDVHYLKEDFAETHALAVAIKNGITMNDIRDRLRQADFHLTSYELMKERFSKWPEALSNTMEIAKKCSGVQIRMDKSYLPKIDRTKGISSEDLLKELTFEGLKNRFETLPAYENLSSEKEKIYWDRVEYELSVINNMGFPDYFLIVHDFIAWAKKQGIPVGPGRGSGAGSLVAYALTITNLDPLPYNLLFERFLNPDRVSLPDFDIDFCQWRREEVINYCVKKYGSENVAQITTFGKMQAKGAVKSVGRAMNLGFNRVDRFTKLFPPDLGITLREALEKEPRLREEMMKDDSLRDCVTQALKLEGLVSHTSVHAAGLVISDGPMTNYVPIYTTDGNSFITQYEMKPAEKVGLVKFDFLGLKTLTVIDQAIKLMKNSGVVSENFSIDEISLDDKNVYDMLSLGHTCGIFQCESAGMTALIKKLKPSCFEDVIALVALFRPGPLGSGMVDDFIERKHGRQKIEYLHPSLEKALIDTYGMILYQEQVQAIAATLANYSLGEADLLRRAMGKKIPEEMAQQRDRFLRGASENKIPNDLAAAIFDLMAEFAKYGFNKSHSAAYGLVSYQTAYLKCYYPEYFMAASMTCDMDNTDKIKRYVEDVRRMKITLTAPSLKESQSDFSVPRKGMISFALAAIKGVGSVAVSPLLEERRKDGFFKSLGDLAKRVHLGRIGKKNLELLVEVGAFDYLEIGRKKLVTLVPDLVGFSTEHHENKSCGQFSLFDMHEEDDDESLSEKQDITGLPWDENLLREENIHLLGEEELFREKELLGVFVSAHPLDFIKEDVEAFGSKIKDFPSLLGGAHKSSEKFSRRGTSVCVVALLSVFNKRRTKRGSLMASFRLEQGDDYVEAVAFEKTLESLKLPETNTFVWVRGSLSEGFEDGQVRYSLEDIKPLEDIRLESLKGLILTIEDDGALDSKRFLRELSLLSPEKNAQCELLFVLKYGKSYVKIRPKDTHRIRPTNKVMTLLRQLPEKNFTFSYVKEAS